MQYYLSITQIWWPDSELPTLSWWKALCGRKTFRVGSWSGYRRSHHSLYWDQGSRVHCQDDHKPYLPASGLYLSPKGQNHSPTQPDPLWAQKSYFPTRGQGNVHTSSDIDYNVLLKFTACVSAMYDKLIL